MDGNRRWSKINNLDFFEGHKKGSENIKLLLKLAIEHDIKYLSVYAFSSENWSRTAEEVNFLKDLILFYLANERDYFIKNKIKLLVIGEYVKFGDEVFKKIKQLEEDTANFDNIIFIVAINYGARFEIVKAINNIIKDVKNNKITEEYISEELFSNYLYTKNIPDPDLLIRTGGEKRLSNFLLWQLSYSEMVFEDIMWPDFNENCFKNALNTFYSRERRIGK